MRNRILKFIAVYLLIVAVFITQRPIFFAVYHSLFEGVGIGEFFGAIGHGLPHDLSMAGYLTAIPGLLLIASVWTQASLLKKIERGYFLFASIVMSMVFITDLALYGYWGFRLDYTPVFYFMSSPADALASVSPWFVAAGVAAIGLYAWGIYRLLRLTERIRLNRVEGTGQRIATGFGCLLLTGALFLPIRGGLTTATMNPGTVYFSDNQRLNHAAMNPMFSFLYSATHQTNFDKQFRYMDDAKATRLFAAMTDRPVAAADSVPRLFTQQRPNVILVILESFSVHLMPSLGGEDIAPCIDRYAREGVIFSNFYANSFRTDRGLVSIISGYPAQPNTSIMKYTEKVENLPSLSRSMKNVGYDLAYYYGGDANFTNMRAFLVSAGFNTIISDKDFPLSERTGKWGAQDGVVFDRLWNDLQAAPSDRPLLRVIQTSSSHEPWEVPFERHENKIKNSFAYADDCLGKFVERLRQSPLWNNTVVIMVPDHFGGGDYFTRLTDPVTRHHIPLVMLGGAVAGHRDISVPASQIDLAATLLYQLGLPHDEFTFSKNVLNPDSPKFGYFTDPSCFGMITDDNRVVIATDAERTLSDEGTAKGKNAPFAKAFLQKLYDDLAQR